jgi:LCP family protein required for cell wall assembly
VERQALNSLDRQEKVTLSVALGTGVLIWSALALAFICLQALSSTRQGIAPPELAYHFGPIASPTLPPTVRATSLPLDPPTPTPPPTSTPTPLVMPVRTRLPNPGTLVGKDTMVVALLGLDSEQGSVVWRTDSIMLAFVQPKANKIGLLSLPRDLWVVIPGYGQDRINTVDSLGERRRYPGGGPALFNKMLQQNFGLEVDHWVRIDFGGFARIVDAVGGVTVNIEDPINDRFPDPLSPTGWVDLALPAGPSHMGGRMALSYCRSRISGTDFDRSTRQQQVLLALWKRALTPETLLRAPKLWTEFRGSFETDLSLAEAVQLGYAIYDIGPDNLVTKTLGFDEATPWQTPGGAQVLLPHTEAIKQIIRELGSPLE